MPNAIIVLSGERYGKWTVQSNEVHKLGTHSRMQVKCDCGTLSLVRRDELVKMSDSDGCRKCSHRRYNSGIPYKHERRLLGRISQIINRCLEETHADFKDYGERGIKVSNAWVNNRSLFLAYLVTLPGWDNPELQIDRIKNEGHYEPGNIRFTDSITQANNRRKRKSR
jgi:hypothetical protein